MEIRVANHFLRDKFLRAVSWQEKIKNHRHFSKAKYFLAVPIFLLLLFLLMRWTPELSSTTLKYLPANTSFYWQWSDRDFFDNQLLGQLPVIKTAALEQQETKLSAILSDAWPQVEELVWFRVAGNDQDYYILRLPKAKSIAKRLNQSEAGYYYEVLAKDILAIYTKDQKTLLDSEKLVLAEQNFNQGINIYWQVSQAPDFLQDLSKWLKLAPENQGVYANLRFLKDKKISFNVWQNKLRRIINTSSTPTWPNQALVPYDANLVLGFSSNLTKTEQEIISQYFIHPLAADLPYYNMSQRELEELILRGSYLVKNSDAWLLISISDWQPLVGKLVPDFKLKEVKKLLPDRTAYIAYELDEQSSTQNHEYRGQNYWQVGNLYGWGNAQAYYLSNQANLIEKTIASQVKLADLIKACNDQDVQINDILLVETKTLPDLELKAVLEQRQIDHLTVFSYQNEAMIGWRACF